MNQENNWNQLPFDQVVIVVEGKSDQQRLHLLDARLQTIATGGSAFPKRIQSEIQQLEQTKQLMILTDPDVQGERIRRLIKAYLKQPAIDLYLRRTEARSKRHKDKSLGIEHASLDILRAVIFQGFQQLSNLSTHSNQHFHPLSDSDLRQLHLIGTPKAGRRRAALLDALRMGYVNGKHLAQRLNWHQVTQKQVVLLLKRLEETDQTLKGNEK